MSAQIEIERIVMGYLQSYECDVIWPVYRINSYATILDLSLTDNWLPGVQFALPHVTMIDTNAIHIVDIDIIRYLHVNAAHITYPEKYLIAIMNSAAYHNNQAVIDYVFSWQQNTGDCWTGVMYGSARAGRLVDMRRARNHVIMTQYICDKLLQNAVYGGNVPAIALAIDWGGKNIASVYGLAIRRSHIDAVKYLWDRFDLGHTGSLSYARNVEMLTLLRTYGNREYGNAFLLAIYCDWVDIVKLTWKWGCIRQAEHMETLRKSRLMTLGLPNPMREVLIGLV